MPVDRLRTIWTEGQGPVQRSWTRQVVASDVASPGTSANRSVHGTVLV